MTLIVNISIAGDESMADDDELENTSDEIASSEQLLDSTDDNVNDEAARPEVSETDEFPDLENSMSTDDDSSEIENGVTQAEVYENLKRIGELEDEKRNIQEEIWKRTEQLRAVVKHIDRSSILHKILESALSNSTPMGPTASG